MIEVPSDGKIWLYGPALVNVESAPVEREDYENLPALCEYMVEQMRKFKGIGLAAPQVGIFKQFAVVELEDGRVMDFINPEIVWMHGKELAGIEGCLSVPPIGNNCIVPRMEHITVEFRASSNPHEIRNIELSRRDSVVMQHQFDHLTGTFFFDRVSNSSKLKILESFRKWKKENNHHVENHSRSLAISRL